jgi:Transposase DDE domain
VRSCAFSEAITDHFRPHGAESVPRPHAACRAEHDTARECDRYRTTRHAGYAVSQQKRKRVEEVFGWVKTVALLRKVRHRGVRRVGWLFTLAAALYNLVGIRNMIEAEATG